MYRHETVMNAHGDFVGGKSRTGCEVLSLLTPPEVFQEGYAALDF